MKELKTYIFEGFFSNVGANNRINQAIDAIKDASLNDKIDSYEKKLEFANLLVPILKDIETDIKKGRLMFEYIRNDESCISYKTVITLEITESGKAKWTAGRDTNQRRWRHAEDIAFVISMDLLYEVKNSPQNPKFRHSIANTIKVTEFKLS